MVLSIFNTLTQRRCVVGVSLCVGACVHESVHACVHARACKRAHVLRTRELEWTGRARAGGGVGVGPAAGRRRRVGGVGGDGEGPPSPAAAAGAVRLLEGLGEGGVQGHVRLVVGEVAELHQEAVLGVELAVARHQHWRKHWWGGGGT